MTIVCVYSTYKLHFYTPCYISHVHVHIYTTFMIVWFTGGQVCIYTYTFPQHAQAQKVQRCSYGGHKYPIQWGLNGAV